MSSRIPSLDILRGIALFGLLLLNIVAFSMPSAAYFNPTAYVLSPLDIWVFSVSHVLFDQKFMAIFSMLFGASTLLFLQKAKAKGKNSARLFFIRNFWLFVFGFLHFTFLWSGDILLVYATCALLLFFFRNLSIRTQFLLGLLFYLLPSAINIYSYNSVLPELTLVELKSMEDFWSPSQEYLQSELNAYNGTYVESVNFRINSADTVALDQGAELAGFCFLIDFFGRALGMMLFGMVLLRKGFLSNKWSKISYKRTARTSLTLGILLALIGIYFMHKQQWDWRYSMLIGRIPNTIGTPLVAVGLSAIIMLWTNKSRWSAIHSRFAAIGRTALSGYIMQSVLATYFFYGFGLGYFGTYNRLWQLFVVVTIWCIQLVVTPIWTARFQYGPIEFIWRTLTYFKVPRLSK